MKPTVSDIGMVLGEATFRNLYCAIFCLFFVFAGLMNFLPFELKAMQVSLGETGVGLLYMGYGSGVIISMNSRRIIRWFKGESRAIAAGIVIFICGTLVFMVERYVVMFCGMFVFCTGLFLAHSLLSGYVNKLAENNKGIANGVYISFYYMGGTLGSFLPGVIFQHFGWHWFLGSLLLMQLLALVFLRQATGKISSLNV